MPAWKLCAWSCRAGTIPPPSSRPALPPPISSAVWSTPVHDVSHHPPHRSARQQFALPRGGRAGARTGVDQPLPRHAMRARHRVADPAQLCQHSVAFRALVVAASRGGRNALCRRAVQRVHAGRLCARPTQRAAQTRSGKHQRPLFPAAAFVPLLLSPGHAAQPLSAATELLAPFSARLWPRPRGGGRRPHAESAATCDCPAPKRASGALLAQLSLCPRFGHRGFDAAQRLALPRGAGTATGRSVVQRIASARPRQRFALTLKVRAWLYLSSGKQGRGECLWSMLPLPPETIRILACWLKSERPLSNAPEVFLSLKGKARG